VITFGLPYAEKLVQSPLMLTQSVLIAAPFPHEDEDSITKQWCDCLCHKEKDYLTGKFMTQWEDRMSGCISIRLASINLFITEERKVS